ncbi:MAG TPA: MCE family protein [Nitriliruptorales bacterium]
MSVDANVLRRLMGSAGLVLIIALGTVGWRAASAPAASSYTVTAILGRAGSGLNVGTDVKVRGARIGQVESIDYVAGEARAVLRLRGQPPLPPPDLLTLVVTAKTLLGEKQVELSFPDDAFGTEASLAPGDTIVAARQPTEVSEVLDVLEPFFDAIDPDDLAALVEALGAQRGEGEAIAENIDLGQQLAAFGARAADQQLAQLGQFADVAGALADRADDLTRLSRALPEATRLLTDRQAAIRANLDALSRFAVGFAEFLEVEESQISQLLRSGDLVGAVFERQMAEVGETLYGLYRYAYKLGHHAGDLSDGTEFAFFRIYIDMADSFAAFCADAGPLADFIPVCGGGGQ